MIKILIIKINNLKNILYNFSSYKHSKFYQEYIDEFILVI